MNKLTELQDGFVKAVQEMKDGAEGTYYWYVKQGARKGRDWAVVLGWREDDNPDEENSCHKNGYSLAVKLAFQPSNSGMQCDYDYDWTLPYDEKTGEVYDMEVFITKDMNEETLRSTVKDVYDFYETVKSL